MTHVCEDLSDHLIRIYVESQQDLGSHAALLLDNAQKNMLGADVGMGQRPSGFGSGIKESLGMRDDYLS